MKFNSKSFILVSIILFFVSLFIVYFFSLSSDIYREGMQVNGADISGTEININGSINDTTLVLTKAPKMSINVGDLLLTHNGSSIKDESGNQISIESGSDLTYSLSNTATNVSFNTIENYIIFSIDTGIKKESVSKQVSVNGKIDSSLNFVLTSKPNVEIKKGNALLFSNGDKVKDASDNPIYIDSANGVIYTLTSSPNPDYDLFNKTKDYIIDNATSSK
jgi:hypothetical protein